MERLSDYLVFCDMDNTLLTAKEGIPACNRSVIRLFTAMGGRFTVASGRPPESIRAALGDIELSLPAISCNGSLLYDFQTNRVLRRSCLNQEQAAAAIADMLQKFPKIGAEVMAGAGEMYVVHASNYTHAHQVDEHMESVACPLENVPDGWLKVVFAGDPETIRKAGQYAKTRYFGRDNYFLPTNQIYLEIMPSGISKAAGMEELCHILNENIKKTIVIGDYYNDLEIGLFRGCGQCAVRSKSSGQRSDQLRLHRRRGGRVPLQADQQGGGRMKHRESEQTQLRVSRLLNRDSVMLHAEMPSVQTALETLVELQESNGVITNGTAYYKAVCERERAGGTTAIGEGLAIPHACNAGVASLGLAALTLTRGLDWGAADGKLVDMIFMVAVPPDRQSDHLLILARLVNLLSDHRLTEKLRMADTREAFIRILNQTEAAIFA